MLSVTPIRRRVVKRAGAATAAVVLGALGLAALAPGAADAAAAKSSGTLVYTVHPKIEKASLRPSAIKPGLTPAQCVAQAGVACQTPDSIRSAYNIPSTINGMPAGTGQTVVIVDAFGSPTLRQDLATFSSTFGLPAPNLNVFYPSGKPTYNGSANQQGWAEETSLDVQWAHAVAPGATIDLVIAPSNYGNALNIAQRYAVQHHLGNVMSMSFGEPEYLIHANSSQVAQSHKIYQQATAQHMSIFASSADDGSDNGAGYPNFNYPASDPLVTAVGGTNLWVDSGTDNPRETVWGDFADCPLTCQYGPIGATGGAPSLITSKPGSDVAYNASVYTGVLTYLGFLGGDNNGFYFFGGTSAGSPQWAALTADVDQAVGHSIGSINQYEQQWATSGVLYDVTEGSNSTPTYTGGYSAAAGYDRPTGYGTPDVGKIITALQG